MNCDLCKRVKLDGEIWSSTHMSAGISGFTFEFCAECEKDRQKECDDLMSNVVGEHIRRTREYWETHPEELAQHKRETEEYRRTCLDVDGFPWDWKRPLWKKVWNWVLRTCGYRKKYD